MSTNFLKQFEIIERIGKGSYGNVYKVRHIQTGGIYVLKKIRTKGMTSQEKLDARKEFRLHKTLRSDYIVKYQTHFDCKGGMCLLLEYMDDGDLEQYISNRRGKLIPEAQIWDFFIQMCLGIQYLHSRRILHRDLKTSNMFLSKLNHLKIGDLGVSKEVSTKYTHTIVGTPYYLSPELCEELPYNHKSDIWALGCILYELCTLKHPFDSQTIGGLYLKITKGDYDPIPKCYSKGLQKMVGWLLTQNMHKRPDIQQILDSEIVTKLKLPHNVLTKTEIKTEIKQQKIDMMSTFKKKQNKLRGKLGERIERKYQLVKKKSKTPDTSIYKQKILKPKYVVTNLKPARMAQAKLVKPKQCNADYDSDPKDTDDDPESSEVLTLYKEIKSRPMTPYDKISGRPENSKELDSKGPNRSGARTSRSSNIKQTTPYFKSNINTFVNSSNQSTQNSSQNKKSQKFNRCGAKQDSRIQNIIIDLFEPKSQKFHQNHLEDLKCSQNDQIDHNYMQKGDLDDFIQNIGDSSQIDSAFNYSDQTFEITEGAYNTQSTKSSDRTRVGNIQQQHQECGSDKEGYELAPTPKFNQPDCPKLSGIEDTEFTNNDFKISEECSEGLKSQFNYNQNLSKFAKLSLVKDVQLSSKPDLKVSDPKGSSLS